MSFSFSFDQSNTVPVSPSLFGSFSASPSNGFVFHQPSSKLKSSSKKVVKRIQTLFEQEQDCDVAIIIETESGEIAEINAHSFVLAPYTFFSELIAEKCAKGKNKQKISISIDKSILNNEAVARDLIRSLYGFECKPSEETNVKQHILAALSMGLVQSVVAFIEKFDFVPGMEVLHILKALSKPNVTGIAEQNREKYFNRYLQYVQTKSNMICNSVNPEILQFASENPSLMAHIAFKVQPETWFRISHFPDEALIEQMRALYSQVVLGSSTTSTPIPSLSAVEVVTADEKTLIVPKAILSTGSTYLKERIEQQQGEEKPVIDLTEDGVTSAALGKCLEYLFTGDVETDDSTIFSVLKTAGTLKMNGLMRFIRKRMDEMSAQDLIHNFSMYLS